MRGTCSRGGDPRGAARPVAAAGLAVEPAAALPLAALTTGTVVPRKEEKVLLVICGANVDPASLAS